MPKLRIGPGFALAAALGDGRLAMADPQSVPAGKYGRAALESLGVDPDVQHAGLGRRMMSELEALGRARGIESVVTQVEWRDHRMIHFLDGAKFTLAELLAELKDEAGE